MNIKIDYKVLNSQKLRKIQPERPMCDEEYAGAILAGLILGKTGDFRFSEIDFKVDDKKGSLNLLAKEGVTLQKAKDYINKIDTTGYGFKVVKIA